MRKSSPGWSTMAVREITPGRRQRDDLRRRPLRRPVAGSSPTTRSSPSTRCCAARSGGSILYRDGIAKISQFSRCCNTTTSYQLAALHLRALDIGVEAEKQGLLGYGRA